MSLWDWRFHRIYVDGLQGCLLLLQLVKRRAVLAQAALQLRGERGAIAAGGCPGQCGSEPAAIRGVFERVLAEPSLEGVHVGCRGRQPRLEPPAGAGLAAQLIECSRGHDAAPPPDGEAV